MIELKEAKVKAGFTVQVGDRAGFIRLRSMLFVGKIVRIYMGVSGTVYVTIKYGVRDFTKPASEVYAAV